MKKFRPPELDGYKYSKPKTKPLTGNFAHRLAMVAHYWGLMPWELRAMPPHKAGELIAAHDVDKEIEAYYSDQQLKRMDRQDASQQPGSFGKIPLAGRFGK